MSILTMPRSIKRECIKILFQAIIVVGGTYLYPVFDGAITTKINNYNAKEQSVVQFVKSASLTITYFNEMNLNYYNKKRENIQEDDKKNYNARVNLFFDKLTSIDIPYDIACSLVKIRFDNDVYVIIDKFESKLDEFLSIDAAKLNKDNYAQYIKSHDSIWEEYTSVVRVLTQKLQQERESHVFKI